MAAIPALHSFAVVGQEIRSMLFPAPLDVWRELGEICANGLLIKASRETVTPLLMGLVLGGIDWKQHADLSCLWEAQEKLGLETNPARDEIEA